MTTPFVKRATRRCSCRRSPRHLPRGRARRAGHLGQRQPGGAGAKAGIVVEGVTDIWRYGPGAVALLGMKASTAQLSLIAARWGAGAVAVVLDGDAAAEAEALAGQLRPLVRRVVVVRLPAGQDPGGWGGTISA